MINIWLQDKTINNIESTSISIWFWVTLAEFIIIVLLVLRLKRKQSDLKFSNLSKDKIYNAKKTNIDMNNLMNSINNSKNLYKELSRTCHPDRFINSDKHSLSEEIFQDISRFKRDFQKLTELKERAIIELNINFK